MKFRQIFCSILLTIFTISAWSEQHFPAGESTVIIPRTEGTRQEILQNIAPLVQASIAAGHYPGAVILIGHKGKIIYRGIFGNRRIEPDIAPMRLDTMFDAASLTKVLVTAPAIMQLVEQNKINLDAPVAHYWPAFAENGKQNITVRELLTHTSGLPAEIFPENRSDALNKIQKLKLLHPVGTTFLYSDVNFITLGYIIEKISGESLEQYAQNHIFLPLGMRHTTYLPNLNQRDNIAPTEKRNGLLRWGEVHDPITATMGGVSGAAGIFTTASDLGVYAQALLDGGRIANKDKYILGPLTILKMTTPQTPENMNDVRGFGWDIDSRYSNRGVILPTHSYGHSGWTGTSIWIDPTTQTWIVILTSRAHPKPTQHNQLIEDRRAIANFVAASITDVKAYAQSNTGKGELARAYKIS